jgi:hypothetical protein
MSENPLRVLVAAGDQDARRLLADVPRMDTRTWPRWLRERPIGWEGAQQQQIVRCAS